MGPWIGVLVFIWVIAVILGSVPIGEALVTNSTVMNPVQGLMSYGAVWSDQGFGTAIVYPIMHPEFFGYILQIIMLDFPMFGAADSPWQVVRWIILAPIIATVVFGLIAIVLSFFQKNV